MKCGNIKEWVREMQTCHVDFSHGIGGLKPPPVHIGAPPMYAPGHQISSDQKFGLATKAQRSRWRPCHKGNAHHLLHWSSWRRLHYRASHEEGVSLSSAQSCLHRFTPSRRVDDLPASHQDSKGLALRDYNYGSLKNQPQHSNNLLSHSLLA